MHSIPEIIKNPHAARTVDALEKTVSDLLFERKSECPRPELNRRATAQEAVKEFLFPLVWKFNYAAFTF